MFIIRPVSPKAESNARLTLAGDRLKVFFPPKREDFRLLIRGMDFEWSDPYWARSVLSADALDRLIETGCKLLAAGFCVAVAEKAHQVRIVAQDYRPEQRRWVKAIVSGDYEGWFSLSWHHTEDYYKQAKKIEGARYSKPSVVVPPERYEEVADFAERYGFALSVKASAIAEAARAEALGAVVVAFVPEALVDKPEKVTGKPAKLMTPEMVEIDHDLLDSDEPA